MGSVVRMGEPSNIQTVQSTDMSSSNYQRPTETWKGGLFGCCGDIGVCLTGCCAQPCLAYDNAENLKPEEFKDIQAFTIRINKSRLMCCLLGCFFPCIPAFVIRQQARDKYDIQDTNLIDDVGAACCCAPCVQCQVGREIKQRELVEEPVKEQPAASQ